MKHKVIVGTCGFPISKQQFFEKLKAVEIQDSFYSLPRPETALRWREQAPEDFIFTVKAWQGITHLSASPTWRRAKIPKGANLDHYGSFKPTEEVFSAWDKTKSFCKTLGAKFIVFQSPASFEPSFQNEANLENFFTSIERGGLTLGWEPRGKWLSDRDRLTRIFSKLNLVHVVDPLWDQPTSDHPISYFRLHGLGRRYNYKYEYTKKDLLLLSQQVKKFLRKGEVYVMFNVVTMQKAAEQFQRLFYMK